MRHQPHSIGLSLDDSGWTKVQDIIDKTQQYELNQTLIRLAVETNDKQRFQLSEDGKEFRANQGHSIEVDLKLQPITPPDVLLHGTAERFLKSILQEGLTKQNRHHVHLTESKEVAQAVGARYGKLVLLEIDATEMYQQGMVFYRSANNVWLTENVLTQFINVSNIE